MGKAPDQLERFVGTTVLFLFPITTLGVGGLLSVGMGLASSLIFVLVAAVPRYRHALPIGLVWVGCLLTGPLLTQMSITELGRSEDRALMLQVLISFGVGLLAFLLLLWGRWKFGARYTLLVFALGTLAQAVITPSAWMDNPWKYALAWPVTVVLLTLPRRSNGVLMLLLLGVASVVLDFRSFAAVCLLAAVLVMWRRRPNEGRQRTLRPLVAVAVLAFVGIQVGTYMALQGYLGYSIQARTFDQTQGGEQSALVGGRPEMAAAWGLATQRPIGFGPGVVPAVDDVTAARSGLHSVGADTGSGYVGGYLFGGHIELHSVATDLWVNFGPLGVVLALMLGGWILAALARSLSAGGAQGWWVFVALLGLWDLAFSPLGSNLLHVVAALAVALPLREQAHVAEPEHADEQMVGV